MAKAPARKPASQKAKAPAKKPAAKPARASGGKPRTKPVAKPSSKPTKRQAQQRANAAKARAAKAELAEERGLTEKQEMFCREYLIDMNGQKAAERAGYSPKTARVQAAANLTKPNIAKRLAELKDERVERVNMTSDWVVQELGKIAQTQPEDLKDTDMKMGQLFMAKLRALQMLGQHFGVFNRNDNGLPEAAMIFDLRPREEREADQNG